LLPQCLQLVVLLKAQKQASRFGDYLAELRARFKPKRNFIKLLDGARAS
jgi:hypothetical protein